MLELYPKSKQILEGFLKISGLTLENLVHPNINSSKLQISTLEIGDTKDFIPSNVILIDGPNLLITYLTRFYLKGDKSYFDNLSADPEKLAEKTNDAAKNLAINILRPFWLNKDNYCRIFMKPDTATEMFRLHLPEDNHHTFFISSLKKLSHDKPGYEDIDGEMMLMLNDLSRECNPTQTKFILFTMDKSFVPVIDRCRNRGFHVTVIGLREFFMSKELRAAANECFELLPNFKQFS
jgi:uncharacterized LabA/DUF88 family protein